MTNEYKPQFDGQAQYKAKHEYDAIARRNAAIIELADKAYDERNATKLQREKDRLRNAIPTPSDYEKNRAAYIEYLLMCVRLGDWHGVSDAANDLRVLEAKNDRI